MLRTLELRDFAIVDALALELEPGFNALTGETGAGKSILIDALSLLTGGRADSALIRAERDAALVLGLFEDAPFESASRRLSRNGRHSARIDGEVVTVSELVERSAELVAIFGQHGATELMRSGAQRRQLDRMLGPDAADELQRYHQAFRRYREVTAGLSELREAARDRARRLDMLAFQIGEIDAAELTPGEETRLEAEVERLRHAERIALSASHAFSALADAEPNAVERAAEGLRELRTAARHDARLEALVADLEQAATALQAVADEVGSFLSDFQADPARLDAAQGRLAAIEALRRKYGASVADVLDFRDGAAHERERLEHVEADTRALEQEAAQLRERLAASAGTLTAARQRAADELSSELLPLLAELGMDRARFEVELETTEESRAARARWGALPIRGAPRRAARAAVRGSVGRRAVARDARAQPGHRQRAAGARLRRDRRRHRRAHRAGRRRPAQASVPTAPGARRHPPPPGGRFRRRPVRGHQGGAGRPHGHAGRPPGPPVTARGAGADALRSRDGGVCCTTPRSSSSRPTLHRSEPGEVPAESGGTRSGRTRS